MPTIATAQRPLKAPSWPRTLTGAALAAAALVVTLALLRHGGIVPAHPWSGRLDAAGALLAVCAALPLVLAWRFPLSAFLTTAAASILLAGLGYAADVIIGPTVALYLLVASRNRNTQPTSRATIIIAAALLAAYLAAAAIGRQAFPGVELLHTGLAWGAAWFAGERTRLRSEQIASLHARAIRAEQDAERERQLAIAEERTRIARDLHDSAGHAISVIAVRAGAARLNHHQHPERSLAALDGIEQLARQTAAQLDQIVGSLRDRDDTQSPIEAPPGVASLDTLVANHIAAGLNITISKSGTPPPAGGPADQAVYRILQEALTNAARHGSGTANVTAVFNRRSANLTITNPIRSGNGSRLGGGHGLVGMRERVNLLGGTLHTGAADGLFRVQATIPIAGRHP